MTRRGRSSRQDPDASAGDAGRAYVAMPAEIQAMLARGQLGRKSGEGYYVWGDGPASTKPSGVSGL